MRPRCPPDISARGRGSKKVNRPRSTDGGQGRSADGAFRGYHVAHFRGAFPSRRRIRTAATRSTHDPTASINCRTVRMGTPFIRPELKQVPVTANDGVRFPGCCAFKDTIVVRIILYDLKNNGGLYYHCAALLCSCVRTRSASLGDSPNLRRSFSSSSSSRAGKVTSRNDCKEGEIEKVPGNPPNMSAEMKTLVSATTRTISAFRACIHQTDAPRPTRW
jgi:hypothetical protein